jgi:hypothetical protein
MRKESLREKQSRFARMVGYLINFIYSQGFEITFGDAWAKTGHIKGSFHYKRLAIDLNLFKDGKYLTETKDHLPFGIYWESLGGSWGGRFKRKDGNHYSLGEK